MNSISILLQELQEFYQSQQDLHHAIIDEKVIYKRNVFRFISNPKTSNTSQHSKTLFILTYLTDDENGLLLTTPIGKKRYDEFSVLLNDLKEYLLEEIALSLNPFVDEKPKSHKYQMDVLTCKHCSIPLFSIEGEFDYHVEAQVDAIVDNVTILSCEFSYDSTTESGSTILFFQCKDCQTNGTLELNAGGQSKGQHEMK